MVMYLHLHSRKVERSKDMLPQSWHRSGAALDESVLSLLNKFRNALSNFIEQTKFQKGYTAL